MRNGPRNMNNETPNDLNSSIKKLFKYLGNFKNYIFIAIILAALSSVLSIIGPNRLSNLTDEISKGLIVNQDNITEITKLITENFSEDNIVNVSKKIINIKLDKNIINDINRNEKISKEDKLRFNKFLVNSANLSELEMLTNITCLPESIVNIIIPTSIINDVKITSYDKVKFIELSNKFNKDNMKENIGIIKEIPESISKILLPSIIYKDITITSFEQIEFIKIMSNVNENARVNEIYDKLDKSPESIKNLIEPKMDFSKIKALATFMLILYLISAVFNFIQSFIMADVSNNFAKSLREKISTKINKLPLSYFDKNSFGDILSRVTNDIDTIGISLYQSLGSLVGAITLFLGTLIMMFITNWILAITAIVSSIIGFIFMFIILGKSQKYFNAKQTELGKLDGHIEEIYSSHTIVKAYNGEKEAIEKFEKFNNSVYESNRMSQFLSGLMPPIMHFIGNFGYVAVCIVGALLVMNDHITFGVIVAFMSYVRLFSNPLSQIAQGMVSLQSVAAASERVFEFLEAEEMNKENSTRKLGKNKVKGNIEFKNVKFGYNQDKIIIKDFNLLVKPGEKIAIVGPTGAGKTTLVNLIMKFYEINKGDILIDNISIKDLTRENIHDLFTMVLQDTWLFNGTIRDNIKFNKKNISDKKIWEICKIVGVDHFIKSLPNGLDYEINDNESISAGQKQLLTIARAMATDTPFLILDEATSSVDTRTEELVASAMDKLSQNKTSFIIAHRLSTIKNADKILVINNGDIIEQGNHKELMELDGFYKDLYESQFKKNNIIVE